MGVLSLVILASSLRSIYHPVFRYKKICQKDRLFYMAEQSGLGINCLYKSRFSFIEDNVNVDKYAMCYIMTLCL